MDSKMYGSNEFDGKRDRVYNSYKSFVKEVKKWAGFRLLSLRSEGPLGSCGGLG
jgi:hypothetical protein